MKKILPGPYKFKDLLFASLLLVTVWFLSLYDYLLFHSLVEIFSVVIAFSVFIIAWNSKAFMESRYILLIGVAYLCVGGLDTLHLLSYSGMGVFKDHDANLPTQLWIAARFMESVALLVVPVSLVGMRREKSILSIYLISTVLILLSIFYWNIFPDCFVEGEGLTPFKKISEYIICLILSGALYLLYQKRKMFDPSVFRLLSLSIIFTIIAELCFTFYISVYGFSNFSGHIFKVISFYLIYRAIIYTGLKKPYDIMFRQLSEKEKHYREIFDTTTAVKMIVDPEDGSISDVNPAACDFYGYSKEKLLSLRITDINIQSGPLDSEEINKAEGQKRTTQQFRHRVASGEIKDVEVFSGPIQPGGKPLLYSIITDITHRKKIENELEQHRIDLEKTVEMRTVDLKRSQERYQGIINNMQSGVIVYEAVDGGKDFVIKEFNRAAQKIDHVKEKDAIGKLVTKVFPGIKQFGLLEVLCRVYETGQPEFLLGQKYFDERIQGWRDNYVMRLPSKDIVSIYDDNTWRKVAEEEQKKLQGQLYQSQKMESIGTLAGGIAHDFNNILAGIIGYTELAMSDLSLDDSVTHDLLEVLKAGSRAERLVQQILIFCRKGNQEIIPLRMDLVLNEVLKLLRATIPATIEIKKNIDPDELVVLADQIQIHQVIMNICTNAYQSMRKTGGTLGVSLHRVDIGDKNSVKNITLPPGPYLELKISDTGSGIKKENLEKIFDPYFTTSEPGEGTGLGLAVVHGIVKGLNGDIVVDSEEGNGTTFIVYLPAGKGIDVHVPEKKNEPLLQGDEHILLVDDDKDVIRMHEKILTGLGYKITAMQNACDAVELFAKKPDEFDLVITDMTMPEMTGARLAGKIFEIKPEMPVILCTGYSEFIDAEKAASIGIAAFISKPVLKREFANTIRKVIDK